MRAWGWHLLLAAAAALVVIRAVARHVPTAEAERVAFDGEAAPEDRVWAAHLAACRAELRSPRLGDGLARAFLASEHELLREAALLIDLCRHGVEPADDADLTPPPLQEDHVYRWLASQPWTPHSFRSVVLHRRKVGGKGVGGIRRMTMTEAAWFLRTLRGEPLPSAAEIDAYFEDRGREAVEIQRALVPPGR